MLKQLRAILALAGAAELLWLATYGLGPLRESTGLFLALIAGQVALWGWSFFRLRITPGPTLAAMLACSLLFRLTLLPAQPHQSEDVYRYIWDARVASAGISPYRFPPEAPELEQLRDGTVYPMLNSKSYLTVYPPLSQLLFRASRALFGESITGMKAIFCALEFGALLLAWRLVALWRLPLQGLLLWAWNPLFVFEFSHSGHSDSAMVFFAVLSIYLLALGRNSASVVSWALAALSKLHPALWLPVLLRRTGIRATLPGAVLAGALLAVYHRPESLAAYVRSLGLYYRLFEFNAGIHYALRWLGRVVYHEAWDKLTGPYLVAIVVVIAAAIAWKFPVRDAREALHAAFWIMSADLLLGTTIHPWYLSWAAFALPFFPYAFMVYWTGAALLSYAAYGYHPVYEPTSVLLIEYVPIYVLLALELRRRGPLLSSFLERAKP